MSQAEEFQARSTKEGRAAQEIAIAVLTGSGFTITDQNKTLEVGATVNVVASDRRGDDWYFDISGAFTTKQPGLIRTDTMWKTLGRASVLSGSGINRLILMTTNLPRPGSIGDRAMRAAALTYFDAVEMLLPAHRKRLERYAAGPPDQLPLPGFRSALDIYRPLCPGVVPMGATLAVPIGVTGDAITVAFPSRVTAMPHRFKVYLPSEANGAKLDLGLRRGTAEAIKAALSRAAGGCTAHASQGSWLDPFGGLVDEEVMVVEAYSAEPLPESVVQDIVLRIKRDLHQEAVAVVVNDMMLQFAD